MYELARSLARSKAMGHYGARARQWDETMNSLAAAPNSSRPLFRVNPTKIGSGERDPCGV